MSSLLASIVSKLGTSVSQFCIRSPKLIPYTENPNAVLSVLPCRTTQIRKRYLCWRMLRDVKRRRMVKEYAKDHLRINSLRKNILLPREIQEIADKDIAAHPRDSFPSRLHDRCVLTSRPRGLVKPHNISRIMWRLLADYNKLSGVIRAKW